MDLKKERYDQFVVKDDDTLLNWMINNLEGSKSKIKATLSGHGVRVNGKNISQFDYKLTPGMKIAISKSKSNGSFKNRYIKIVYEDKDIVVLEKNIGVLSMAAGHSSLNVKTILDEYFRQNKQHCTAHVVHRLDRDTSGLMIYAKDTRTEQLLEEDWHHTVYDRRYVAVLSGEVPEDDGTIENWLKDNNAYITFSSPVDNGGKYAVTHYHVLRRSATHTLVEFRLETGRKNQIRVHSADMGCPVCGDVKYGNGDNPINRLCLHAYMLCFIHPITHKRMEFETQIPSQFLHIMNNK